MIFLDSDVLIEFLRRREPVTSTLEAWFHAGEELAVTSVNVAEVLRGESQPLKRLAVATRILDGLTQVPFGPKAARRFALLMSRLDRDGRPMPVVDGMVAATVLEAGGRLLTHNERDFRRAGLELL